VPRDPLSRLPTTARLWSAAALCLGTLGLRWSVTNGFLTPGYVYFGDCGYSTEEYCTPDQYLPGTFVPGSQLHGYSMSARVFVVFAGLVLAAVAGRVRTAATRRLARLATAAIGVAAVLAAADRAVLALICLVLALALTVPVVWSGPKGRLLAPGAAPR
jgi:hypothetical protein